MGHCRPKEFLPKVVRLIGLKVAPSDKKDGAEKQKPNWGKIYAQLICHTNLSYEEIERRTIPQIEAILSELPENISIKIGMPGIFGGVLDNPPPTSSPTGKPPKLSEFAAFCSAFDGIS